ncbi:MAG: TfpX/TfpZ family type IV pilin accessory protein [Ramlibacter sp.]
MLNWKDRIRAAGIHLGLSLGVAALAGALVFGLWYRYPYREISGGRELFLIVMAVDVAIGPLITLAVFNRAKPASELRRDLGMVALLQLAALGYGLWTVMVARPVHLVFEFNRFRVVHAIEVPAAQIDKTPPGIDALPLFGPTLLSLRPFKSPQEETDATLAALQGAPLSARPELWQTYEAGRADVLKAARAGSDLLKRFPAQSATIDTAVAATGRKPDGVVYLPLVGRKNAWTVFLDPATAQVLSFARLDSF